MNQFQVGFVQPDIIAKGVGEKVLARVATGGGVFGIPTMWSDNRFEQVQHHTGWNYVAVTAICEEIACLTPQVGIRRPPEHFDKEIRKSMLQSGRLISRKALKSKAMTGMQAHEEMEAVDSDHRLCKLLNHPNVIDTAWSFRYRLMLFLELCGNSYIWKIPSELDGAPAELWVVPAPWVRARRGANKDRLIDWYDVRPWGIGGGMGVFQVPTEEMIHLQYPNPISPWDGYSASTAGSLWIDNAEAMDMACFSMMKEGVWPGLILGLDKESPVPDEATLDRLYAKLEERSQGDRKFKRPLVLGPGTEVLSETRSNDEMGFTQGREQMRDFILALRKVTKTRAGITDEVNRASMETADAIFAKRCIKPKLTMLSEVLTRHLAQDFDERLMIYWDDPVSTDPDQRRNDLKFRFDTLSISPNEIRDEFGEQPYEHGGDNPISMGMPKDVPWATGQADPLLAPPPMPGMPPGPGGMPPPGGAPPPAPGGEEPLTILPKAMAKRLEFAMNGNGNGHGEVAKIGPPPFPGAQFNPSSHRWEQPNQPQLSPENPRIMPQEENWSEEIEEVDPNEIDPKNDVRNDAFFEKLVDSMREEGWQGDPIVAARTREGIKALNGSHRLLAARDAGIDVPVVAISVDFEDDLNLSDDDYGLYGQLRTLAKQNPDNKVLLAAVALMKKETAEDREFTADTFTEKKKYRSMAAHPGIGEQGHGSANGSTEAAAGNGFPVGGTGGGVRLEQRPQPDVPG